MYQRFRVARLLFAFIIFSSLVASPLARSQTSKRVYLAPDDDTDLEWSADEAIYRQAFLNMLDYYINQLEWNHRGLFKSRGRLERRQSLGSRHSS
jgi:hypothetical protein